jgi:hypothetical protein
MAAAAPATRVGAALLSARRVQRYWRLRVTDHWRNRACGDGDRLLVIRHHYKPHFYNEILDWVARTFPELHRCFELSLLPCRVTSWERYRLLIPWLQDPVQNWSPEAYTHAMRLHAACDERGIPVINRVDRLGRATKSTASRLLNSAGVRTPRMARVTDADEFRDTLLGLNLPLFVREDWGHGGLFCRAETKEEARAIPIERFTRPLAVEVVDARDRRDGMYRKYRYVAAGDAGVSHHLQVTVNWITRGTERVKTDVTRDEELAYIARQDQHHAAFQRARRALSLDFVGFDYGYDAEGQMVVWEVNPFPLLHFSRSDTMYRNHAIERTVAAILALYLDRAGIPKPARLTDLVSY